MGVITYDIDQAGWGSRRVYADGRKLPWKVDGLIVHYGGPAPAAGNPVANTAKQIEREKSTLRGWQNYHIDTRGWTDIGYNYAIGQSGTIYRLRGENRGGHTAGDLEPDGTPENWSKRAVAFILGGTQRPTEAALDAFRRIYAEEVLPVYYHRQVFLEGDGGTNTQCPGEFLINWVESGDYAEGEEVETIKAGDTGYTVSRVQKALNGWIKMFSQDKTPLVQNGIVDDATVARIKEYQAGSQIPSYTPGVIGAVTYGSLMEYAVDWVDPVDSGTVDEAARTATTILAQELSELKNTLRSV